MQRSELAERANLRPSSGRLKLKLRDPVRYLELLARNRGLLHNKVAPSKASSEGTAQVHVVPDRPMSDEEFERACGRAGRFQIAP